MNFHQEPQATSKRGIWSIFQRRATSTSNVPSSNLEDRSLMLGSGRSGHSPAFRLPPESVSQGVRIPASLAAARASSFLQNFGGNYDTVSLLSNIPTAPSRMSPSSASSPRSIVGGDERVGPGRFSADSLDRSIDRARPTRAARSAREARDTRGLDRDFWVPDSSGRVCYECAMPFSVFKRRHHCRLCGQIFCGDCCERTPLRLGRVSGTLRVCSYCSASLRAHSPNPGASRPQQRSLSRAPAYGHFQPPSEAQLSVAEKPAGSTTASDNIGERRDKTSLSDTLLADLHGEPTSTFVAWRQMYCTCSVSGGASVAPAPPPAASTACAAAVASAAPSASPHNSQSSLCGTSSAVHQQPQEPIELCPWCVLAHSSDTLDCNEALGRYLSVEPSADLLRDPHDEETHRVALKNYYLTVPPISLERLSAEASVLAAHCFGPSAHVLCPALTCPDTSSTSPASPTVSPIPAISVLDADSNDGSTFVSSPVGRLNRSFDQQAAAAALDGKGGNSKHEQHSNKYDYFPTAKPQKESRTALSDPTARLMERLSPLLNSRVPSVRPGQSLRILALRQLHHLAWHILAYSSWWHPASKRPTARYPCPIGDAAMPVAGSKEAASMAAQWAPLLNALALQAAIKLRPGDAATPALDVRSLLRIVVVPGGHRLSSEFVSGVVCRRAVALRDMPDVLENPHVLVLKCDIEYERSYGFTEMGPLIADGDQWLNILCKRIIALKPNVVLVQKTVHRHVALRLRQHAETHEPIVVVPLVPSPVLSKVASVTGAQVVEQLGSVPISSIISAGPVENERQAQKPSPVGVASAFFTRRVGSIPLVYILSPPDKTSSCASIVLRGGENTLLRGMKKVLRFLAFAAHNLLIETEFLVQTGACLPPLPSLDVPLKDLARLQPLGSDFLATCSCGFPHSLHVPGQFLSHVSVSPSVLVPPLYGPYLDPLECCRGMQSGQSSAAVSAVGCLPDVSAVSERTPTHDDAAKELAKENAHKALIDTVPYDIQWPHQALIVHLSVIHAGQLHPTLARGILAEDVKESEHTQDQDIFATVPIVYYGATNDSSIQAWFAALFESAANVERAKANELLGHAAADGTLRPAEENSRRAVEITQRCFSHGNGRIVMTIKKSSTLWFGTDIVCWRYCRICGATSQPQPLSSRARSWSLGKFLEVFIYAKDLMSPCGHHFTRATQFHFAHRVHSVIVNYIPMAVCKLAVPRSIMPADAVFHIPTRSNICSTAALPDIHEAVQGSLPSLPPVPSCLEGKSMQEDAVLMCKDAVALLEATQVTYRAITVRLKDLKDRCAGSHIMEHVTARQRRVQLELAAAEAAIKMPEVQSRVYYHAVRREIVRRATAWVQVLSEYEDALSGRADRHTDTSAASVSLSTTVEPNHNDTTQDLSPTAGLEMPVGSTSSTMGKSPPSLVEFSSPPSTSPRATHSDTKASDTLDLSGLVNRFVGGGSSKPPLPSAKKANADQLWSEIVTPLMPLGSHVIVKGIGGIDPSITLRERDITSFVAMALTSPEYAAQAVLPPDVSSFCLPQNSPLITTAIMALLPTNVRDDAPTLEAHGFSPTSSTPLGTPLESLHPSAHFTLTPFIGSPVDAIDRVLATEPGASADVPKGEPTIATPNRDVSYQTSTKDEKESIKGESRGRWFVPNCSHPLPRVRVGKERLKQLLEGVERVHFEYQKVAAIGPQNGAQDYLLDMKCILYFQSQFSALRHLYCGYSEAPFIESLSRCEPFSTSGGKSGSAFFITSDGRYLVKRIKAHEHDSLLQTLLPQYFRYMAKAYYAGLPATLVKILGLFKYEWKVERSGGGKRVALGQNVPIRTDHGNLLVMQNLFHGHSPSPVFDLKGSVRNRLLQEASGVLLDENFIRHCYNRPDGWLFVDEIEHQMLSASLLNDTLLLLKNNVMDYSLLLGVDVPHRLLILGVIDYARPYKAKESIESALKSVGVVGGTRDRGRVPTVVDPKRYRSRFREAIRSYIMSCPSKVSPWVITAPSRSNRDPAKELEADYIREAVFLKIDSFDNGGPAPLPAYPFAGTLH